MKIFSVLKPSLFKNFHPQEDFFGISKKHPIFVVADGVALNFDDEKDYPKHSGAGEVAKIFCETVIFEAEKRYKNFKEQDLKDIFKVGNKAVLEYNNSQGRTKDSINYWDFDLFSATTAFVLIKGPKGHPKAYWWTLCDSGVALYGKKGSRLFISPDVWTVLDKFILDNFSNITGKERTKMLHRDYRNAVGKKGELTGYGVVDGEETAKFYLNIGTLDINAGDFILLFTDGFENYLKLKEFTGLFLKWPENLENQLENIISKKSKLEPKKYGQEKTLIAIAN